MAKVNWGVGLKRVFIACSVVYLVVALWAIFFGISTYRGNIVQIPDKEWHLYSVLSPQGQKYLVYAAGEDKANEEAQTHDAEERGTSGNFDPTTAKPVTLILSQGETFEFPEDTKPWLMFQAITKHFKEARAKADREYTAYIWGQRGLVALFFALGYGVICAILFSLRWIIMGFRSEKA